MPIAPQIVSSAISAGASLLGSFFNAFTGSHQRKQALRDSKAMMNYQNEINLKNWRLQNEYNAPSAQLERLRAAGLNPSLHGIDGSTIPMQSVGLAENSAALTAGSNRQAAFSGMLDASSQLANLALLKSQKQNIDEDTRAKQIENDKKEFERSVGSWTEDYLSKWWNNNISSQSFVYGYASSILQAKRAGLSPKLEDGRGGKVYTSHDAFDFNISYDDAAKWVKTEFDDMVASLDLKRSQESYFYKTASAAFGNLAVALSRASHQNNLDDATAELQRAAKDMQELKTFMIRNGFNENDSPLDRMIKKFGEFIGIDFALPE